MLRWSPGEIYQRSRPKHPSCNPGSWGAQRSACWHAPSRDTWFPHQAFQLKGLVWMLVFLATSRLM